MNLTVILCLGLARVGLLYGRGGVSLGESSSRALSDSPDLAITTISADLAPHALSLKEREVQGLL